MSVKKSAAKQLRAIKKLRSESFTVRMEITDALKLARRAKDRKAIQKLLDLRRRTKTVLIHLNLVEKVIKKAKKP
jgi:hypothetical protein